MEDVKYTQVAAKAVSLAELFDARFEQGLDGPSHFRIELSAPDGPSTGGGKQALQHIKLLPAGGGTAIVIGSANTTRQTAEIRTFENVSELYSQRFHGARIPVDATRYRDLSQALAGFFRAMKMTVTFSDFEAKTRVLEVKEPAGGSMVIAIVLGVVFALGILGAAYWMIFLRR